MSDFCFGDDGIAHIMIDPDGLPSGVAECPTAMYSPDQRLSVIENQLDLMALEGKFVDGWQWVKNPVLDGKGEKTTARIQFRTCKNETEAKSIVGKIKKMCQEVMGGVKMDNIEESIEHRMYDENGNEIYKKGWKSDKIEIKFNKDNRDSELIKDLDKVLSEYGYEHDGFYLIPNNIFIYEYSKGKSGLAKEVQK